MTSLTLSDLQRQVRTYELALKEIVGLTMRIEGTRGYKESNPVEWLAPLLWEIRETVRIARQLASEPTRK
jgi:hypothetical protein